MHGQMMFLHPKQKQHVANEDRLQQQAIYHSSAATRWQCEGVHISGSQCRSSYQPLHHRNQSLWHYFRSGVKHLHLYFFFAHLHCLILPCLIHNKVIRNVLLNCSNTASCALVWSWVSTSKSNLPGLLPLKLYCPTPQPAIEDECLPKDTSV